MNYAIPAGFNALRKDRELRNDGKDHGGVLILYKNNIKARKWIIDESQFKFPTTLEVVASIFQINFNKSIILCTVYIPDKKLNHNNLENLECIFGQLLELNYKIYIVGDFNRDLLLNDYYARQFNNLTQRYNLSQCVSQPTRYESLLDLFITNDSETSVKVVNYGISDHSLVIGTIKIKVKKAKCEVTKYRDYSNIDLNKVHDLINTGLKDYEQLDVNSLLTYIMSTTKDIFDKVAPVKVSKTNGKVKNRFNLSNRMQDLYQLNNLNFSIICIFQQN